MVYDKKLYCLVCDDIKTFQHNATIGHSQCQVCASRFGVNPYNNILLHFQAKIEKIKEDVSAEHLMGIIRRQRTVVKRLEKKIKELNYNE